MARVEVLLRYVPVHSGCGVFQFGPIRVNFRCREVTCDQKSVTLAAWQFQLLQYLIERRGRAVRPRNFSARSEASRVYR